MFEVRGLMVFYENMLALNNVSLTCGLDRIIGVFGANSAGKSTLMYTLSGIMDDIRKKEEMAGRERITIRGEIIYQGRDIMKDKPSQRAKAGIILCPERRRIFPGEHCPGESQNRRILGQFTSSLGNPGLRVRHLSCPHEVDKAPRRISERRRAADACHRTGPDGPAEAAAPGRASPGS